MKNKYILIAFLLCQIAVSQEFTNEEELDQIVINDEKMSFSFSKNNKNIQVITKDDIAKLPASSINEILSYVTGVDIRQRGPFGSQSDISIDGGSFEQTMILWNGVKIGDPQTAHHSMNIPIPIAAIERIEILKGPAARVYGINSLTGAVNIVTNSKQSDFIKLNTYVASSFNKKDSLEGKGVYAAYGSQLIYGKQIGKTQHLFGISSEATNGQRYNTEARNYKLLYQGNYQINDENNIHLIGSFIDNSFGANGYYAAPADKESFELVKTMFFNLGSKHSLSDRLSLETNISNRYNEDDYRFYRNDLSKARSLHFSNVLMFEIKSNYKFNKGELNVGYELRNEEISSSNLGKHSRENMGGFIEYKANYLNRWFFNIGSYFNYNSDYDFQFYPGVDVSYQLSDFWKIYANVGSSQRIPSFTDLYVNQLPGNKGNPNLKPEEAWQYDAGFEFKNNSVEFLASFFNRKVSNFIDWIRVDASNPYSPNNFGNQDMLGVFSKIKQQFNFNHSQFSYQLSYQYLEPSVSKNNNVTSKYVVESLKHQAILGLNYAYKSFEIQLQNRFIKRFLNDAYFVTDVKLSKQINKFNIYLQATNLFNSQYKEVAAVPMPTRWYQVGATYQLSFKK